MNPKTPIEEFDFDLDPNLIAKYPLEHRDSSRLLHFDRKSQKIIHRSFKDISEILEEGDVLVRNNSQVLPARFWVKDQNDSSIEILLIEELQKNQWTCLAKPQKKLKINQKYFINELLTIEVLENSTNRLLIGFQGDINVKSLLQTIGSMPIPPYLKREAEDIDKIRYQCVYAVDGQNGSSIAAPTAGLHFTENINQKLLSKGVEIIDLTLHVGLGTFQPIKTEYIEDHKMHSEKYSISETNWNKILKAKSQAKRIISVGSTSTRVLESIALTKILEGETDIFIKPQEHNFQIVNGIITNFHLPKSTLILLVAAFIGKEQTLNLYQEAIKEKYRFYSYGDSCLLL